MNNEVSFGAWIRQRRKTLDLTQEDLAQRVGCSVSAIRKIEADERRPSRQIAELLAEHLEIPSGDRPRFLKVARAELRVDRLSIPSTSDSMATTVSARSQPSSKVESPDLTGLSLPPKPAPVLPLPPTPLIGRKRELTELALLLRNSQCRLLSLIGPGGIGKTRLAIQAALETTRTDPDFPEGAAFVSLAPVRSPESVIPAIADAIAFTFYGPGDPKTQLLNALRERTMLLVLDNVEHLLTPLPVGRAVDETSLPALLGEILQLAPGVKLLATSRERLNLQGEWVFEIHGLPIPPDEGVEALGDYSAVSLFVQSARRVRPGFELNQQNRASIVRICQLTDGMPLGIELAAAWTRVLACDEIVQEIERSLDFLAASARDLPERHRSLRTVFDHSWNLLTESEQRVLRALSVFRGSFRRDAAAEVAAASLSQLSALVDKSLLQRTELGRYDLHELVRQYAAEKLHEQPDEADRISEAHCEYYLRFLHEREERLNRERQAAEEIRVELVDIRAAWLWALSEGRLDLLDLGASTLARFYRLTGLLREGEIAFDLAAERVGALLEGSSHAKEETGSRLLIKLLVRQAGLFNDRARHSQAVETARRASELARASGDARSEAAARLEAGVSLWRQANYGEARQQIETALALARPAGVPHLVAAILTMLGVVELSQGGISEALSSYEEALSLFRKIGDRHGESGVLNRLGTAYFTQGNLRGACAYYEKALQIFMEFGDRRGEGMGLSNLGIIHQGLGDNQRARQYFEQTLPITHETGDRWGESAVLANLGVVMHRLGDFTQAGAYYEHALGICREIGEWGGEVGNLSNLGLLAYHLRDFETAERYQQQVLQMARDRNSPEVESLAWMRLGRVWADREHLLEAKEAFRRSLGVRRDLGRVNLTLEPMAGLASVELALGELPQALDQVEDILSALDLPFTNLLNNADEPYWVYLICIQVLRAGVDGRAESTLDRAYTQLQKQAAQIDEDRLRDMFLEKIPGNRELVREWQRVSGVNAGK